MRIEQYLDYCLKTYYIDILKSNGFQLVKSKIEGMGAGHYFKSDWLNFNIVNDRGVILTTISSIYSKKEFDFAIINAYFIKNSGKSLKNHQYGKKLYSYLSPKQESKIFAENIESIKLMFNEFNIKQTESKLQVYQKERAKLLFG